MRGSLNTSQVQIKEQTALVANTARRTSIPPQAPQRTKAKSAKRAVKAPTAPEPQANGKAPVPKRGGTGKKVGREVYQIGDVCSHEYLGYTGMWEIVQMPDGICHVFYTKYDWKNKRYPVNSEKHVATARNLKEAMGKAKSLLERDERHEQERVEAAQSAWDRKHGKSNGEKPAKKNGGDK
jgi:hypothetical protein